MKKQSYPFKLKNAVANFKTITHHRHLVMQGCFRVGLYRQGLLHDLSKYTPSEFIPSVCFYQGDRSPHTAQREVEGIAPGWLHHKGRNRHHLEYWIDYNLDKSDRDHPLAGGRMPLRYVVEMFMDRVAACKNYQGSAYTDRSPYEYYSKGRDHYLIHEKSRKQLEFMLEMLAEKGEEYTFAYIKRNIVKKHIRPCF